ncbi:MAG: endonuclease/exonuclease/phosphatase family protein [Phycisphaerales bacterium]|nr:endonuclease/exonuclease/phosphatase family protein [Phycisphaerales bacterium]
MTAACVRVILAFAFLGPLASLTGCAQPARVHVATWNIWHGGREDGEEIGPARVARILRESGADLIALQETYGSGERLSADLGMHFHARGTNVSILSRWPITQDLSVHEPFKCVGALVQTPLGPVAFYSIWLPYDAEIWEEGTRPLGDEAAMLAACASSAVNLRAIEEAIEARLAEAQLTHVPVVLAGDFNSMSHLDYTPAAIDQYHMVIDWPTSRVMSGAGYRDVYRELHPRVDRARDRTWTPRFPRQEQDRIDFIYVRGDLAALRAEVVDRHDGGFPSDHALLRAEFRGAR